EGIYSLAAQADGKIVAGGFFTTVGASTRNHLARFSASGTLDSGFDPNANDWVWGLTLLEDGSVLAGGAFTTVDGVVRDHVARLANSAATQSLTVPSATRVEWLRGGSSPESHDVSFGLSTDGG